TGAIDSRIGGRLTSPAQQDGGDGAAPARAVGARRKYRTSVHAALMDMEGTGVVVPREAFQQANNRQFAPVPSRPPAAAPAGLDGSGAAELVHAAQGAAAIGAVGAGAGRARVSGAHPTERRVAADQTRTAGAPLTGVGGGQAATAVHAFELA